MTATSSRVKVKTPKSGSERLELVLLESDINNNKASISSLPSPTMQPHTQPAPQPTPKQPYQPQQQPETRNDNNTMNYLPNQYNNSTTNSNNNTTNIDDNSSYLTGCSASTAETDNRASSYNNNRNNDSLEMSWSREYTDANVNDNTRGVRDGREVVGVREAGREGGGERESVVQGRENDDDESDLYGSLEQCESIININNVLSNTAIAKNDQPAVNTEAVKVAAVESEEETSSQQSPQQPIQSSPTNLQYKKSVSFDQSLDELLTSATTTTSEEEESSSSSSTASDKKKKMKKKSKKKKGSDGSVKSEDTSVESMGYKVKTTFGKKKSTSKPKQQETATPSNSNTSTSSIEEEDTENNPSLSSQQQQQQKTNRRKSAPKVLRVSKYSKQKSTSSATSSEVAADIAASASDRGGTVDVDKVETNKSTKGKSKDKKTSSSSSSTRTANDVESACSIVTEPLLDVLMREEQQQQQNVNKEGDIPEVVQEQEKSVTRRELRKQRTTPSEAKYDNGDLQQYGQQQQQQPRLQHRRTLPRDHPNYQSSQRSDHYNNQYRDDTNSSIQRSNSNVSNATSLYSAYSNVALDGYVDPNLTTNGRKKKKKEKKEKKGMFRKTARVAIKGVKGSKKLGKQFIQKVKDWYDDDDEDEEYDVDDYGASVVMTEYDYGNDEYRRRDQEKNGQAGYSFEGYDHLKSPRASPRGGSKPPSVPSHQGNGTMANPWTGIGGPQDKQGSPKVSPNFANNINPWSDMQSHTHDDNQQQHGEYNQEGMPSIKWWTWKQKEKRHVATTAAADDEAEDEESNESMEYTYFAFLSKVKAS